MTTYDEGFRRGSRLAIVQIAWFTLNCSVGIVTWGCHMRSSDRDYDAVVVGASLAGCSTAMLLARGGARVALVERSPDPQAFKRICGHFIQSSAVPALERIGLLDAMEAAGAVRSRLRIWTRWGVIE